MVVPRPHINSQVYVDFDGTMMLTDTTDFLFERFALPEWRAVEEQWAAGLIGSRECMARQVDLLRATPEQIAGAVDELEMDPGCGRFLATCDALGFGAIVVSDGLDVVIQAVLRKHDIDVPFFANRLVQVGADRWRLEFPNARPSCDVAAGHCKCARIEEFPGKAAIVVGDGRSDFCIASRAQLVLAKSKLVEECRKVGRPHFAFRELDEAADLLEGWFKARSTTDREMGCVPLEA